MEWRVDDTTITVGPKGMTQLAIGVDGAATASIPNSIPGRFAIPWKKRDVELRRIGPSRGLESALYVDGVLVPPSSEGPVLRERAECGRHGKPSRRRCPGCDTVLCPRCASVDGVRCEACLHTATEAARSTRRRGWLIGAAFLGLVVVGCVAGFFATGNRHFSQAAGAMLFGALYMAYAGFRTYDGASLARAEVAFAYDEDAEPQLVGERCRTCKKRISSRGSWCGDCRRAFHGTCVEGHECKPPKRGPDWDAVRGAA